MKYISDEQEAKLVAMFSEKGWNLVDHRVSFTKNHSNPDLLGKSGIIKKVKNEIASIEIDRNIINIPFTDILNNTEAKVHRN